MHHSAQGHCYLACYFWTPWTHRLRGQWGVHIFLFLSGYGIFKSAQKNGMAAYWRKRLVGVFVPYILFSVFKLGILLVMGEEVGVGKAFCTLMGLDFCLNVDPTMWYITYIFVCYAVFYAAWPLYRRCRVAAFTSTLFVSFVLIAVVGRINIAWNTGAVAWVYFWTFPAGVMLAMHEEKIARGVSLQRYTCLPVSQRLLRWHLCTVRRTDRLTYLYTLQLARCS